MIWCIVWVTLAPAWFPSGIFGRAVVLFCTWPSGGRASTSFLARALNGTASFLGTLAYLAIQPAQNLDRLLSPSGRRPKLTQTFNPSWAWDIPAPASWTT